MAWGRAEVPAIPTQPPAKAPVPQSRMCKATGCQQPKPALSTVGAGQATQDRLRGNPKHG